MKDQFVDYATAKMLKEIEMNEKWSFGYYQHGGELIQKQTNNGQQQATYEAYLWQQVEQWLWEKHNIMIQIKEDGEEFYSYGWGSGGSNVSSPITAKIEGIKQAVKHLHNQLKP